MYSAMMDPELLRIAQEQMSRIPPEELARLQQTMMSNPELLKMASEGMRNMRTEDIKRAAEQMKHTTPEDMAEIGKKIANAKPEEVAAMKAQADSHISYVMSGAKMLKEQGNELHSRGKYHEASKKYLLAKNNLKELPLSAGRTLQLQCAQNLMSCYLKTGEHDKCIIEGSEVLTMDSNNVKAYYRRGQAYKELGNLEAALADLRRAHDISPEDDTIADVMRDVEENLRKEGRSVTKGVIIEEIEEEETSLNSCSLDCVPSEHSITHSDAVESSVIEIPSHDAEISLGNSGNVRDGPSTVRAFQNYVSNADPNTMANLGMQGLSPDMIKTATQTISSMKPEELQKMVEVASSLKQNSSNMGPQFPEMSPEMMKMASDMMSNMSPDELQNMMKVASSLGADGNSPSSYTVNNAPQPSENKSSSSRRSFTQSCGSTEINNDVPTNQRTGDSSSSASVSPADLQESMRNSMKDPALRQMFSSMMKNMSPEMMANMSEQFGMKLSKEDAEKAQKAMSSLSPEDLDRMMKWADRAQRGIEAVKKTKSWLLGRQGLILAFVMLILAFIFQRLGFIG